MLIFCGFGTAGASRRLNACVAVSRAVASARSEEVIAFKDAISVAFKSSPDCVDVQAVAMVRQTRWARSKWFKSAGKAHLLGAGH